jgi:hypothetical protein
MKRLGPWKLTTSRSLSFLVRTCNIFERHGGWSPVKSARALAEGQRLVVRPLRLAQHQMMNPPMK